MAFEDIFGQMNDSTKLNFRTRSLEDYGDVTTIIQNPNNLPVIIQLTDTKDKTIKQQATDKSETIVFLTSNLESIKFGSYMIQIKMANGILEIF